MFLSLHDVLRRLATSCDVLRRLAPSARPWFPQPLANQRLRYPVENIEERRDRVLLVLQQARLRAADNKRERFAVDRESLRQARNILDVLSGRTMPAKRHALLHFHLKRRAIDHRTIN